MINTTIHPRGSTVIGLSIHEESALAVAYIMSPNNHGEVSIYVTPSSLDKVKELIVSLQEAVDHVEGEMNGSDV